MSDWNLDAAWIGILIGMISGASIGLFFHRPDWLGGYQNFSRRLVRLGHISFFGLAFVNLAFVGSLHVAGYPLGAELPGILAASSILLLAGAVLMPAVCFLSAWKEPARHLFFLPVGSLLAGVICLFLSEVL